MVENTLKFCCLILTLPLITSCSMKKSSDVNTIAVNTSYFIKENLVEEISEVEYSLWEYGSTLCYKINIIPEPTEHDMGPWCPTHIDDSKEKGGIWFKEGKVYNVDGHFITSLDEFYSDSKWQMFREDGSIKVTKTKEECAAAARPNVDEKYHNYCVECLPEYYEKRPITYFIPVKPLYLDEPIRVGRDGLGLAFNGIKFDAPVPTHAILEAHTLAPLDDHGGHVNLHTGYHYHAATGYTKEIDQEDGHASMIGYAIDGFGIFARTNNQGEEPTNLDECGGHYDETRGYHYHAGAPGDNQIIACLHGAPGAIGQ